MKSLRLVILPKSDKIKMNAIGKALHYLRYGIVRMPPEDNRKTVLGLK